MTTHSQRSNANSSVKASAHVAFIDSGIGGLSILSQVKLCVPNMQVSYFMDNHFLPYGELESDFLVSRLADIVRFLQSTDSSSVPDLMPDLIVIACNTASTQALEQLRNQFDMPFVGVVPAIKPAAQLSKNKQIGLLATKATVNGQYIQTLIEQYAADCQVTSMGSSEVVACAEDYFWQGQRTKPLPDLSCFNDVDTLVLGCTHFPLIKAQLSALLPAGVVLLDSGQAIARRVKHLLDVAGEGKRTGKKKGKGERKGLGGENSESLANNADVLYCTKPLTDIQIQRLKVEGFQGVETVAI